MSQPIFHLADPGVWAQSEETYTPASLESEGFIHCSTSEQLLRVARERYKDRSDLVLLKIDPEGLYDQTLVYEDSYGKGEEFPHVYGPLPISAVIETGPYLEHLEEDYDGQLGSDHPAAL